MDLAADEMNYSCMRSKGSTGYILSLGPVLSSMTSLICLLSLCRWFQGPTTASAAEGFAIVSVALTLVGFWVVEFQTDNEFLQAYMMCGRNSALFEPPYMVDKGVYFDGTPCMDVDTVGDRRMNPYVETSLKMTAVYTAGGVCNLLATVLLLVSPPPFATSLLAAPLCWPLTPTRQRLHHTGPEINPRPPVSPPS